MTVTSQRLEYLKTILAEDADDSFVKYAIAKEYEKLNELKTAIEKFELLRKEDSEYVGLYYHLAHIYTEIDEIEKALEIYDAGIKVAKAQNDLHALSELMNARVNAEI
jgi:tetratricopeptide (TPR) repeat protein